MVSRWQRSSWWPRIGFSRNRGSIYLRRFSMIVWTLLYEHMGRANSNLTTRTHGLTNCSTLPCPAIRVSTRKLCLELTMASRMWIAWWMLEETRGLHLPSSLPSTPTSGESILTFLMSLQRHLPIQVHCLYRLSYVNRIQAWATFIITTQMLRISCH